MLISVIKKKMFSDFNMNTKNSDLFLKNKLIPTEKTKWKNQVRDKQGRFGNLKPSSNNARFHKNTRDFKEAKNKLLAIKSITIMMIILI